MILEINVLFIFRQERQGSGGGPSNLCHLLSGLSENHLGEPWLSLTSQVFLQMLIILNLSSLPTPVISDGGMFG